MMKMYIAYGSNMNRRQMEWRCPDARPIGTGHLEGWKLIFRGNGRCGVANIEPEEGSTVPVVIWEISAKDEKNLDVYEGYPHLYVKKTVRMYDKKKRRYIEGMAYIMTDGHKISGPSGSYLSTIAEGYDDFGLDASELLRIAVECGIKEVSDEID
ncbi:gamma-glutamyl AIG2-like cyclotransferase [Fusobacterium naviforme]|nr:gamma-glutamylcyclotransferase [Fusobacterium naviforme]PSL09146.1 gamma-glutamyl AIG2-like cyclotransferase [Fusobacterium naviforme]STO27670.1 Uncharacterised protein [Fusobacterium naviforme]